jgi:hypothetical protein
MSDVLNFSFGDMESPVIVVTPLPENYLAALALFNPENNIFSQLTVDTSFDPFPPEEFVDPRETLGSFLNVQYEELQILNTATDEGTDDNLSVISLDYDPQVVAEMDY